MSKDRTCLINELEMLYTLSDEDLQQISGGAAGDELHIVMPICNGDKCGWWDETDNVCTPDQPP